MVEMELSEPCIRKRISQPVSIPFLWEEKPGTPKKDWKPSPQAANPVAPPPPPPPPPPPVKLVAMVPFKWEENPGKPLPCFSWSTPEVEIQLPLEKPNALVLPRDNDNGPLGSCRDDFGSEDEQYRNFESDHETCGFETDESFCSAPSPLANHLVSTVAVSNAIPVLETFQTEHNFRASETDSSVSSYATGTSSLVGASFLECLFPLLTPDSSLLEKLGCSENNTSNTSKKVQSNDFDCESNCSVAMKRPLTLGELIMMSRRRSNRRKAVQMRTQNLSEESMKKTVVGCCVFGFNNRIEGLQRKWKRQLQLKLM